MSESIEVTSNSPAEDQGVKNTDDELDKLLTDALNDFNKPLMMPQDSTNPFDLLKNSADMNPEMLPVDSSLLENLWNEPSMKEAMSHFELSIRNIFSNKSNVAADDQKLIAEDIIEEGDKINIAGSVDVDSLINDFQVMAKMTAETVSKECTADTGPNKIESSLTLNDQLSKSFKEIVENLSKSTIGGDYEDNDDNFHNMVAKTIQSLDTINTQTHEHFDFNNCSQQLAKLLKDIEDNANSNSSFFTFMKVCMETMKSAVYPSLKDLCGKYPEFIEKNKSTFTENEIKSYEVQYQVMSKICNLFETEESCVKSEKSDTGEEADGEEMDRLYKKFQSILYIMNEIQECGQIPQELVNQDTRIFDLMANEHSQNCSIF